VILMVGQILASCIHACGLQGQALADCINIMIKGIGM